MKLGRLFVKAINGTLTKEETKIFYAWLDASEDNKKLFNKIKALKNSGLDISDLANIDAASALIKLKSRAYNTKVKKITYKHVMRYAAILLITLGLGYGYYTITGKNNDYVNTSNAITLQLENGNVLLISDLNNQVIHNESGEILVDKRENGIDYSNTKITDKLAYNTLNVPNGKRFDVKLSDGTIVHLNSGSSIKYPVKFIKNNNRQVFLTGEAFFEVQEDRSHPFIVTTKSMNLEVLGTVFNVSAYPEDITTNTTLIEGSVKLSSVDENKQNSKTEVILEPSFMALWNNKNNMVELEQVDVSVYTAWISGKLVLKNLTFHQILKRLERYYGVEIQNNYEDLNNEIFSASFFGDETIEDVLLSFSMNRHFKYEINQDKITIKK